MTWTIDNSKLGTRVTDDPVTETHTCSTDARLLILTLFVNGNTARTGGAPTYNGTTMTDSGAGFVVHTECGVEVWYLINPDTGADYTISIPNNGNESIIFSVTSYIPSAGACAFDGYWFGTGTTQNPSITTLGGVDHAGCLIHAALGSGDRDVPTAGTNYTLIHTEDVGNQTWGTEWWDDAGAIGLKTISFGTARADDWGMIGVAFYETVAPQTVSLNEITLNSNIQALSVSAQAVSVGTDTLQLSSYVDNITVKQPLSVALNTAILFANSIGTTHRVTFETGDLSEFDIVSDVDNDLSVSSSAAIVGSYGLEVLIDNATVAKGVKLLGTPNLAYFCRAYLDPNTLTMADGDTFGFLLYEQDADPWPQIVQIALKYTIANGYEVSLDIFDDGGYLATYSSLISDASHKIEFYGTTATDDVSSDGIFGWWLDGVSQDTASGIDNYNLASEETQNVQIGAIWGMDAGTSGTFYLDHLEWFAGSQRLTVVPGIATLSLSTLELNSSIQDLSISAQAVNIGVDTLQLSSYVDNITVKQPLSVALDTLSLRISPNIQILTDSEGVELTDSEGVLLTDYGFGIACNITVVPGVATLSLNTLEFLATPIGLSVITFEPQTITLNTLEINASAPSLAVSPGSASIQLNTLEISANIDSLTVSPGAASLSLNTLELISSIVPVSISAGAVSIQTNTLELNTEIINIVVSPQAVSLSLNPLSLSSIVIPIADVVEGAASVLLDSLQITSQIIPLIISPSSVTISVDSLLIQSNAISLSVSVGANTISLNTLQLSSQAGGTLISAGTATIGLESLLLQLSADSLEIVTVPSGIVALDTLSLRALAQHIRILPEALVYMQHPVSRRYPYISRILSGETSVAPAFPPQTVVLQTLQLISQIEDITVVPSAATITLDTLQLNVSAENLTVVPEATSISLSTLQLQTTVIDLQVVSTIELDTLELQATAIDLSVVPTSTSITLDTTKLDISAVPLSVALGAAAVTLDSLQLASQIPSANVVAGAASVALETLELYTTPIDLSISAGAVSVSLDTLLLESSVIPATIVVGAVTIQTNTLELSITPIDLLVVPQAVGLSLDSVLLRSNVVPIQDVLEGAVSIPLQSLQLTSQVISSAIHASVPLDTLELNSSAVDLSVVPSDVTIALNTLELNVSAIELASVSIGAAVIELNSLQLSVQANPLDVITAILLNTLELNANAEDLSVIPGATAVALDSLVLNVNAGTLEVALGAASITLSSIPITSTIIPVEVIAGAATLPVDSLLLQSSTPALNVSPQAVTTSLDTLVLTSYIDDISITISELIVTLDTLQLTSYVVPLSVSPGAVSQTLDTLELYVEAVDLFGITLTPSFTVAGCIEVSDELISDILLGDEAISIAVLTDTLMGNVSIVDESMSSISPMDELMSEVTITDTCNG